MIYDARSLTIMFVVAIRLVSLLYVLPSMRLVVYDKNMNVVETCIIGTPRHV